ncbi:MAG TPA: CheR family methyltransferase [Candidatus Eremiobacteraceae bacterium]|nr:CheR family methyltransferase [Candidatus Eremiobacteraceae bacterium]
MADAHFARELRAAGPIADPAPDHLPAEEDRLSLLLERGLGLTPTPHMLNAFIEQSRLRARGLGIQDQAYMRLLEMGGPAARAEWMAVAPALVVGETFLFRDAQLWSLIERTILPELAALAKPTWLWSAGCSTGEEAYTLAIVARRVCGADGARILATDVNPKAIAAARVGVYGQWSLRGVDKERREGLAVNGTQTVRVHDDVKSMVRFETHNLNDQAAYPPHGMQSFELIVCRNVLIYMSHGARAKVVANLASLVSPGGVLILGHGEAAGMNVGDLLVERHDAGVIFRRPVMPHQYLRETPVEPPRPKKASVPKKKTASRTVSIPVRGGQTAAVDRKGRPLHGDVAKGRSANAVDVEPRKNEKARELVATAIKHARAGKLDAAERSAVAAIAADSLDPEPHVLYAALLMARNSLKEAETELRRALFLDPVFVPALWQIGNLYGITERKRQAAFAFARALTQLEGLPPETEALPFDNLSVGELTTLLRAELGERAEA